MGQFCSTSMDTVEKHSLQAPFHGPEEVSHVVRANAVGALHMIHHQERSHVLMFFNVGNGGDDCDAITE